LHRLAGDVDRVIDVGNVPSPRAGGRQGGEARLRALDSGLGGRQRALGVASRRCLPVGRFACCIMSALARVEGMAEGEPVIARRDRFLGSFQRGARRLELVRRVEIGAGGAGGVDRALGLVHLFAGWLGTGNRRRDCDHGNGRRRPEHRGFDDTMKTLAPHDRPREKLDRVGPAALGDNELVAIVIGHGYQGRSALDLANALLDAAGGVHGLARLRREEVGRVTGLGPAKGAQVVAAVELGRRTLLRGSPWRTRIVHPHDAAAYLMPQFGSGPVERFGVLLLDTRHRVIRARLVSVGTLDASHADPRAVYREALIGGAAAIVLFHNHPSGDPTPSKDDVALTARLVAAGALMGIDVVDHVILADNRYRSFKEDGFL
jgi:DNA repair protein RadC